MAASFNLETLCQALALIGLGCIIYKFFQWWKENCRDNVIHAVARPSHQASIPEGVGSLTERQIVDLAAAIRNRDMITIALGFFNINHVTLDQMKDTYVTDLYEFNRQIIRTWAYNYKGNDHVKELAKLVYRGAELDGVSVDLQKIERVLGISKQDIEENTNSKQFSEQPQSAAATVYWNDTEVNPSNVQSKWQAAKGDTKELSDFDLFTISQHLVRQSDLRLLAIQGLKIRSNVVETSLVNSPNDITAAAHRVLIGWLMTRQNRRVAYEELRDALHSVRLASIAQEVRL